MKRRNACVTKKIVKIQVFFVWKIGKRVKFEREKKDNKKKYTQKEGYFGKVVSFPQFSPSAWLSDFLWNFLHFLANFSFIFAYNVYFFIYIFFSNQKKFIQFYFIMWHTFNYIRHFANILLSDWLKFLHALFLYRVFIWLLGSFGTLLDNYFGIKLGF